MPNGGSSSSNHRPSSPHSSGLPRIPSLGTVGSAVGDRIPAYIPGFKTSAAFLSSLGANLRIPDDAYLPSPISTPASLRPTSDPSGPFAPPSPLIAGMDSDSSFEPVHIPASVTSAPAAHTSPRASSNQGVSVPAVAAAAAAGLAAVDPLADVPALSTFLATDANDRRDALKLVADSVAQQRQLASRAVLASPLSTGVFVLLAAVVGSFMVKEMSDWPLLLTTMAGITMACLVGVRWIAGPYLVQAEQVGKWDWLGDDTVICTKFGEHIIGALVLGWDAGEGSGKKNTRRKGKGGRGLIRAWTVRIKYRGKGEGRMLLEEAVKVVQQKGGDGLGFAEDNAYSQRVLPKIFNGPFEKRDQRGVAALEKVLHEKGNFSKKR